MMWVYLNFMRLFPSVVIALYFFNTHPIAAVCFGFGFFYLQGHALYRGFVLEALKRSKTVRLFREGNKG